MVAKLVAKLRLAEKRGLGRGGSRWCREPFRERPQFKSPGNLSLPALARGSREMNIADGRRCQT